MIRARRRDASRPVPIRLREPLALPTARQFRQQLLLMSLPTVKKVRQPPISEAAQESVSARVWAPALAAESSAQPRPAAAGLASARALRARWVLVRAAVQPVARRGPAEPAALRQVA